MKILITGYTTRMHGSTRIQRDYLTFSYLLEDILKEMGYDVERRKVAIGEKIAYNYGFAFCGVAPLNSMTSGMVPETHYVLDQMQGSCAVYADDWSFCSYGDSIRGALNDWGKYLQYKKFPYPTEILDSTRASLEQIESTTLAGNNAPVLAPMFPWGDHNFLMRNNYNAKLFTVDPSAWVKYPRVSVYPKKDRKPEWVMAALSDHSAWIKKQKFSIPVYCIGNKRKNEVFTEDDTIRIFAKYFGVLSTGYPSKGSGWWRTRYLNAAWAETPIYSDPADAAIMGPYYRGSAAEFESEMYLPAYDQRVEGQREWLHANLEPKEKVIETIKKLLNR